MDAISRIAGAKLLFFIEKKEILGKILTVNVQLYSSPGKTNR